MPKKTQPSRKSPPDYLLLAASLVLVIIGFLALASVSTALSLREYNTSTYYLIHQLGLGFLPGLFFAYLAFRVDLAFLRKLAPVLLFATLFLLALVFIPGIGMGSGGAKRWLAFGGVSIQPSEFLKLTFILYLSAWLAARAKKGRQGALPAKSSRSKKAKQIVNQGFSQTFVAFLIVVAVVAAFLILQPDISTLAIILAVAGVSYFLAGTPLLHSLALLSLGIAGLGVLIKLAPYRMRRLLVFLKPETDPLGLGYQIKQALIGIGSGGIFGVGMGLSYQKQGFLPYPMSDSIFAVFAEEAGFIGAVILILAFLVFAFLGFRVARQCKDYFLRLTAVGITLWITLQAFINIGSMIGILPLTGIPLPFISYGGSALMAELIGVGILLNISRSTT